MEVIYTFTLDFAPYGRATTFPSPVGRNGREGILLLLITVEQFREGRRVGTWHPAAALILHRDGMFPLLHYVTKELTPILEIQRS